MREKKIMTTTMVLRAERHPPPPLPSQRGGRGRVLRVSVRVQNPDPPDPRRSNTTDRINI
jgi:hypothetical protein